MQFLTVAFFGHRYIENIALVEHLLEKHIERLLLENEYVFFLVGRNGDFDRCVSSSVVRIQKRMGKERGSLVLVLPYVTAEFQNNQQSFEEYYGDIEISHKASVAHPKAAIQIRNREMADRADLVICYVNQDCGGAFQAVRYAKKQNKPILNLAELE